MKISLNTDSRNGILYIYKYLCIAVFVIITFVIIMFAAFKSHEGRIVFYPLGETVKQIESFITNPILYAMDNKDQSYNIMAKKATEISKDQISLEELKAEVFGANNKLLATSKNALFYHNSNILDLVNGVKIVTTNGEELYTKNLKFLFKEGRAITNNPVKLLSKSSNLTAESMEIISNGKILKFSGSVNMTIYKK